MEAIAEADPGLRQGSKMESCATVVNGFWYTL